MVIFHSYVKLPEGSPQLRTTLVAHRSKAQVFTAATEATTYPSATQLLKAYTPDTVEKNMEDVGKDIGKQSNKNT